MAVDVTKLSSEAKSSSNFLFGAEFLGKEFVFW